LVALTRIVSRASADAADRSTLRMPCDGSAATTIEASCSASSSDAVAAIALDNATPGM
jgi:hypothetical protein